VSSAPASTGFALRDPLPWDDFSAIVRAAETAGYRSLWLPEIIGRDPLVALGALAGETRDLLLATGVLPMRSRTPLVTAMAAATVHERSAGRFVLGVGPGAVGRGALPELREHVATLRALLGGDSLERKGRRVRLSLALPGEVPIWISALGPNAMRLAGEIADGAVLNWCPPERVAFARERIDEGAEAAGRDAGEVAIAVYVRSWVGSDLDEGTRAVREATSEYASYPAYARQFEQVGLGAEAGAAADALRAGRPEDVPEALVRAVTAVGEGARDRLEEYRRAGALPVVYPVAAGDAAPSIEATLLALAPG
jgi:alkanesulfonate monooxygenase SsuD/methylene tetrahydromethanopterin reductase-like flavin-dependent oxidoreductase (luciferase family)